MKPINVSDHQDKLYLKKDRSYSYFPETTIKCEIKEVKCDVIVAVCMVQSLILLLSEVYRMSFTWEKDYGKKVWTENCWSTKKIQTENELEGNIKKYIRI
jgi:hypothetical protein